MHWVFLIAEILIVLQVALSSSHHLFLFFFFFVENGWFWLCNSIWPCINDFPPLPPRGPLSTSLHYCLYSFPRWFRKVITWSVTQSLSYLVMTKEPETCHLNNRKGYFLTFQESKTKMSESYFCNLQACFLVLFWWLGWLYVFPVAIVVSLSSVTSHFGFHASSSVMRLWCVFTSAIRTPEKLGKRHPSDPTSLNNLSNGNISKYSCVLGSYGWQLGSTRISVVVVFV